MVMGKREEKKKWQMPMCCNGPLNELLNGMCLSSHCDDMLCVTSTTTTVTTTK